MTNRLPTRFFHSRLTSLLLVLSVPLPAALSGAGCIGSDAAEGGNAPRADYAALTAMTEESVLSEPTTEEELPGIPLPFNQQGLRAGDLVMEGGLGVYVPPQGEEVSLTVERIGGDSEDIVVTHALDGRVSVTRNLMEKTVPFTSDAAAVAAASPSACSDVAFSLKDPSWTTPFKWWFRASTTPAGITQGLAEWTLEFAANNITDSYNDCGYTDQVGATNEYRGRTATAANISSSSTGYGCLAGDRWSVVDFGTLPKGVLAITCTWSSNYSYTAADVRINKAYHKWFAGGAVPAGCSNRYGIEDVMTHEFGHAFGLRHVPEATHGRLTMSTLLGSCTRADATLGRGDVMGLRAKY